MSTHTPEQIQTQAAFAAWQLGRPMQYKLYGEPDQMWRECPHTFPTFADASYCFRPAPVPVPRYWSEPAHVPGPVCWLRFPNGPIDFLECLIVEVNSTGVFTNRSNGLVANWSDLKNRQHSTDRLNWKPCLVQP